MDNQIYNIINDMSEVLNVAQMKKLQEVLIEGLVTQQARPEESDNEEYLDMFLTAKRIEGCSERTLEYYRGTEIVWTSTDRYHNAICDGQSKQCKIIP